MRTTGTAERLTAPSERERLIEAMARCCVAQGYAETTVAAVAAEAHLCPEDFHRHFRSLEECVLAAVAKVLSIEMATIADTYSADAPERESALQAVWQLLEAFAARPALASLAFIDSRQCLPRTAFGSYEASFAILTAMLDRLRGDDEGLPPPNTARAAIGGGEALVRREIAAGRTDQLPRLLPTLIYGATVPFLDQAEALRLARHSRLLLEGTAWEG